MTDERFDELLRSAMAQEAGVPSERVWRRIQERRRPWWPSTSEVLTAWAASTGVLLIALFAVRTSEKPTRVVEPLSLPLSNESAETAAAVSRIAGLVNSFEPKSPTESG